MTNHRSADERRQIARQIERHLEDNGLDRTYLIGTPGLGKTTVDHFFIGQFAESALMNVNAKLGTSFGTPSAPSWCGGYSRDKARGYEGTYLTIRPEFSDATKFNAYATHFTWTKIERAFIFNGKLKFKPRDPAFALTFQEERSSEPKRAHSGQVWLPKGSYIYLFTTYGEGRLRAAILTDLDSQERMIGVQLTLQQLRGAAFLPAACPIAFIRKPRLDKRDLGIIDERHPRYDAYKKILCEAEENVAWKSIEPFRSPS